MDAIRRNWTAGLTLVLALLYVYIGIFSRGAVMAAGLAGAVLILLSLPDIGLPRWAREVSIAVGALPLAVFTWWSVVTPILAVLVIAMGSVAVGRRTAEASLVGAAMRP